MSKDKIKKQFIDAYIKHSKSDIIKTLDEEDVGFLSDVIWDLVEDSERAKISEKELSELKEKIRLLGNKSGQRTKCLKVLPNRRALVNIGPFKEEILISPGVDIDKLKPGTEVLVVGSGEGRILAEIREIDSISGRLAKVKRLLSNNRVLIEDGSAELILLVSDGISCKEGDEIRYELESQIVIEVVAENESHEFELVDIPDITLANVKGLNEEKKYIMERIIYPLAYKDKYEEYGLKMIRGAIFYGPSGCGKTFIASAIFNEMAKLREKQGVTLKDKTNRKGFFIINGPEVLSKWSGQTEFVIRKIFEDARSAAKESGFPSIIFWDEIESILGRRKDVDTYSPEKTVVPTLLSELHGVKSNNDVILIGATNMPALIDPAMLRPGRLGDLILEIPRPDRSASLDILKQNLYKKKTPELLQKLLDKNIDEKIITYVFDNDSPIAWSKDKEGLVAICRRDVINGAMFAHIGEEIIRKVCLNEIEGKELMEEQELLKMVDDIMLSQVGALDKNVKCGFSFDASNIVLDASFVA